MQTSPADAWQILSLKAAVGAALVAALAALAKGLWALWQQHKELRWKKAELARRLTDTWFAWEASHNALRMVDDGPGEYSIDGYGTHHIDPQEDLPRALAVEGSIGNWRSVSNSKADRLVQKSFDVLLYCFQRIQHSIDIGVVDRDDVLVPSTYYVDQLTHFYLPIAKYMEFSGFLKAKKFLDSFASWRDAASCFERLAKLRERLDAAFASDTAYPGTEYGSEASPASTGHCAVVAAIVQAEFGGQLLSTYVDGEAHWFNRISSGETQFDVDLTGDQFGRAKVQLDRAGRLYPNAAVREIVELQSEARARALLLASRSGLDAIRQSLHERWKE